MSNYNLSNYVAKFLELKEKLLLEKLNDMDASLLASRLIEIQQNIPTSLFFKIKQSEKFDPYLILGNQT